MIFLFLTLQISFLMLHLCSCCVKYSWNRQLQTDKVKYTYLSHYILCFEILKKSSPTQSSQRYFLTLCFFNTIMFIFRTVMHSKFISIYCVM